ncbi:hypothetical protein [Photobacterium leiognathi]|nr:hypothetical protein [Photobacterium leiognathi]
MSLLNKRQTKSVAERKTESLRDFAKAYSKALKSGTVKRVVSVAE